MPTLDELQRATTPVTIQRGSVTFRLDCALEKLAETDATKTTEGITYADLRRACYESEFEQAALRLTIDAALRELNSLADVEAFRAKLAAQKATSSRKAKSDPGVTEAELQAAFDAESSAIQTKLDEANDEYPTLSQAVKVATARRLAYLVGGWISRQTVHRAPCQARSIRRRPSLMLIRQCLPPCPTSCSPFV